MLGSYSGGMTASSFSLTSSVLTEGSLVAPEQVGGQAGGPSVSPDLSWSGAPEGTKSFAVTCYDPDAPTGSGFWHWIAWDIPASTAHLPSGLPRDADGLLQAVSDAGSPGYEGPFPPAGEEHRYVFSVHALPVESLEVDADAPHIQVRFAIWTQALATASVTARYRTAA